jgi:membrane fusion protein (multidrug efflux system)
MSEPNLSAPAQRSRRPFIVLALILATIAAVALIYYLLNRDYATTDDAEIDGTITNIAPQISGRIATVQVTDNQHVAAGQVLATIDPRDQLAALATARANLAQSQAQAEVAQANAVEADANLAVANAAFLQAQQDFARYQSVNPHAISQLQLDSSTASIRSAKAKVDAAQAQAQAMQAAAGAARAAVLAARAAVENARLQLSYTRITAPDAGHVSEKSVEPGDVVSSGTALMALVGDQVWVTANYKETQLAGIHPGSSATVTVDAVPGITFKAHVDSIQYGTGSVFSLLPSENATGNYVKIVQRVPVKIVFDDDRVQKYLLAPGMSVLPSITIGRQ